MPDKYIDEEKRAQINNIINENRVLEIQTQKIRDNQNTMNSIRPVI